MRKNLYFRLKKDKSQKIMTDHEEISNLASSNSNTSHSLNSSYADVFETSGVVIRDYQGSFSGQLLVTNIVTYNLNKCKSNVVIPYYKLLCLIAWRPFGKEVECGQWCIDIWNYFYTFLTFCILLFWYVIRVYTCNGRLVLDTTTPTVAPTFAPTVNPNTTSHNWSQLVPASRFHDINKTHISPAPLFLDPCQHVFGTYIVPSFLHFLAFVIGFYHFRVQEHEGLYALMEKVYLQSNHPSKITRHLRTYLIVGMLWLVCSMGTMVFYFFAFGFSCASGVTADRPRIMYSITTLIVLAGVFSNCVNLAVVLSYCGQCQLLKFYIQGVAERLEEKSTELKAAMKDVLDIKRHFDRLNGLLSLSMSCIVFDLIIVVAITIILLFNYRQMPTVVVVYRAMVAVQWGLMLIFILVQAALLTASSKTLKEKVLSIRVFGYQSHTQLDIDSFLNFLNMVELEAQIFTIPVKPRYLWGVLIVCVQFLIFLFQTGRVIGESKWV